MNEEEKQLFKAIEDAVFDLGRMANEDALCVRDDLRGAMERYLYDTMERHRVAFGLPPLDGDL